MNFFELLLILRIIRFVAILQTVVKWHVQLCRVWCNKVQHWVFIYASLHSAHSLDFLSIMLVLFVCLSVDRGHDWDRHGIRRRKQDVLWWRTWRRHLRDRSCWFSVAQLQQSWREHQVSHPWSIFVVKTSFRAQMGRPSKQKYLPDLQGLFSYLDSWWLTLWRIKVIGECNVICLCHI